MNSDSRHTNISPVAAPLRTVAGALACLLLAIMGSGCGANKNENGINEPFAHIELPDSLPPQGGEPLPGRFEYHSSSPVVDELYRREAARKLPDKFIPDFAFNAYLSPIDPDGAATLLASRLTGGYITPNEGGRYAWPVVTDDPSWLLAASEIALAGGDSQWVRTVATAARNSLNVARTVGFNTSQGLFEAVPSYMTSSARPFPDWMTPVDVGQTMTLTNNVCWLGTLCNLRDAGINISDPKAQENISSEELRRHINLGFWIPNMGYYSALLYGIPYRPLQLQATDNLAQALAILVHAPSDPMAVKAVRQTPVTLVGPTPGFPLWPRRGQRERTDSVLGARPLLTAAAWVAAVARTGNEKAYASAVNALLWRACQRGAEAAEPSAFPITAMIMRGILGLQFGADALYFAPFVPENLPGDKIIKGFRYRDACLDITIHGTGSAISTFTIDGKSCDPAFPASQSGTHHIVITLAGPSVDRGGVTIVEHLPVLPVAPKVERASPREVRFPNANPRFVYLDGVMTEEIVRNYFRLYDARVPVAMQFADLGQENWLGFACSPQVFSPVGSVTDIAATTVARGGTPLIPDKHLAAAVVESSRWHNPNLDFTFTAPRSGRYAVDLRYIDGLGLVNPKRRTALRSLRVNGHAEGVFVLPQLPQGALGHDAQNVWQLQTGTSNTLMVRLEQGLNTLRVGFYQPAAVYIDPRANTVLVDRLHILALDPIKPEREVK